MHFRDHLRPRTKLLQYFFDGVEGWLTADIGTGARERCVILLHKSFDNRLCHRVTGDAETNRIVGCCKFRRYMR